MLRSVMLAALAALVTMVTACADDAGDGGGGDGPTSVSAALAVLPASLGSDGADQTITWSDLVRAAEVAGVERPEDASDTDAAVDYVMAITGGPTSAGEAPPVVALPPEAANVARAGNRVDEFEDEVGWSILDVDRFAEQAAPPRRVTVIDGEVDEAALTEAMGEPEDGTWAVGQEGEIVLEEVSVARPLGEALFVTPVPGGLAVSRHDDLTGDVRGVVEGDGDSGSLADEDDLAALAAALDGADAYSAMIVPVGLGGTAGVRAGPEEVEQICAGSLPTRPSATATGLADDDGPVILVAHAYASSGDAEEGADSLERIVEEGTSVVSRRPWSDMVTVDDVAVTGPGGTVALARLRPTEDGRASMWRDLLVSRDTLVSSC